MDNNEIIEALGSSDDFSEFDDSDADPNFIQGSDSDSIDSYLNNEEVPNSLHENNASTSTSSGWGQLNDNNSSPVFNPNNEPFGINPNIIETLYDGTPYDFFSLFVDEEVLSLLVIETNRYGNNLCSTPHGPKSRLKQWVEVDIVEIKTFLGLIVWMGLVPQPSLASYWSKNEIYQTNIPKYMTRNRFEMLLRTFHCSNNQTCPPADRLYKIRGLVDMLVTKYKSCNIPGENLCIDESIIPFIGRISFRQYLKNKKHRYGIKIFKLCINDGYTIGFKIYAGQEALPGVGVSTKIVMELAQDYLDMGRTIFTDNWYTSVSLTHELLSRNTNAVGTLRANRKFNPKDVVNAKLKKGEIKSSQNENNIVVLKWKDKRDVLMLSTKHKDNLIETTNKRGLKIFKPQMVVDYNKAKGYVDISDLRSSYHTPLRRSLKWYRKIAFEILLNTSLLNTLTIFTSVTRNEMIVTEFRENVLKVLLAKPIISQISQNDEEIHKLIHFRRVDVPIVT